MHPQVAALVYIAGWVQDQGESVQTLIGTIPSGVPSAGDVILPPQDGFLYSTGKRCLHHSRAT